MVSMATFHVTTPQYSAVTVASVQTMRPETSVLDIRAATANRIRSLMTAVCVVSSTMLRIRGFVSAAPPDEDDYKRLLVSRQSITAIAGHRIRAFSVGGRLIMVSSGAMVSVPPPLTETR